MSAFDSNIKRTLGLTGNTTTLSAATAVGNGTPVAAAGYTGVTFRVSGTFVGEVVFYARLSGFKDTNLIVQHQRYATTKYSVDAAGEFFAPLPPGTQYVLARVSSYTSGSITAVCDLQSAGTATWAHTIGRGKNVQIAYSSGATVASGALTAVLTNIDVYDYPYLYIVAGSTPSHDWSVKCQYPSIQSMSILGTSVTPAIEVINSLSSPGDSGTRVYSGWFEAYGQRVTVYVDNNDSVSRNYDVILFGVR